MFEPALPTSVQGAELCVVVRHALRQNPHLPLPGRGQTLERWRALAAIAGIDVCLAKLLEAHYDAQVILAELGLSPPAAGALLAVWAAEPPDAQVVCAQRAGVLRINGSKAWCSGADMVDAALLTTRAPGGVRLVRVDMHGAGIVRDDRA